MPVSASLRVACFNPHNHPLEWLLAPFAGSRPEPSLGKSLARVPGETEPGRGRGGRPRSQRWTRSSRKWLEPRQSGSRAGGLGRAFARKSLVTFLLLVSLPVEVALKIW